MSSKNKAKEINFRKPSGSSSSKNLEENHLFYGSKIETEGSEVKCMIGAPVNTYTFDSLQSFNYEGAVNKVTKNVLNQEGHYAFD